MKTPQRPLGRIGLVLAIAVSSLLIPAAAARGQESTAGGFTTSATVPTRATVGTTVTIRADVTAATARTALVDVELYGPSGQKLVQRYWDAQSFTAGQRRTYQFSWSIPTTAAVGTYRVAVGVFSQGWGVLHHWNANGATMQVASATVSTTTTTTTTRPPAITAPPITPSTTTTTTTRPASTTTTTHPTHGIHQHVPCPGELDETPLGALPPALPMLCDKLGTGLNTSVRATNTWRDDFNHGTTMGALPSTYVQGHVGPGGVSRHFLHNNHWMVDIRSDSGQYPTLLAAWMRPNQTFRPKADGSVVIEFEVATPIAGTRDAPTISDSWPEFAISTAAAPTGMNAWGSPFLKNGTYFYEAFAKADVMGCRMQQSRHPICAFYGAGSDGAGAPDRHWEINQNGTDVVPGTEYGGDPSSPGLADVWATCSSTDDPDTKCRNVFRVTLTSTRIRIDVKKPGGTFVRFYEAVPCNDRAGCATGQMGRILNNPGGFYVFLADFAYRIENNEVIRFHWDHIAVNP